MQIVGSSALLICVNPFPFVFESESDLNESPHSSFLMTRITSIQEFEQTFYPEKYSVMHVQ